MAVTWTNKGRQIVNDRTRGVGTEAVYLGIGTGAGAGARTSTALSTEVETRGTGTSSTVTTGGGTTGDTWQLVGTVNITGTRTITNMANFDASSSGNIDIVVDGMSITLNSGDSIQGTLQRQYT